LLTFCHDSVGESSPHYNLKSQRLVDEPTADLYSPCRSISQPSQPDIRLSEMTDSFTKIHILTEFPHHFDPRDDQRADQLIPYVHSHTYLGLRRAYNHGVLSYPDYRLLNQSANRLDYLKPSCLILQIFLNFTISAPNLELIWILDQIPHQNGSDLLVPSPCQLTKLLLSQSPIV
jgi:hypothetical protein